MTSAAELYAVLERSVASGAHAEARRALAELKLALLEDESYSALGRKTMEQAVLFAVATRDAASFQRHLAQLKPYYVFATDETTLRPTLTGLELLFLIVENRLAEFHMALEALSQADRDLPEVAFAISLEQHLMVGSYDRVLEAQSAMPSPHFAFFMSRLLDTVRDTVAECAEAAYDSLTLDAAKELLMFESLDDLRAFMSAKFPNWNVSRGSVVFDDSVSKRPKSESIPAIKLIAENLAYATELERIV
eukprot:CAMPEP_0198658224 /NCGR_PEP_ID=MMETSP1467-20131203/23816_1 /TAXON_ID=1462469 /ORGANISM="unid. sp., Strain CCMP2135" /LENGTH=248 /DNA_ID=CAMNT_0044394481 /DNA_START=1 /DNA_END=747 /DNA_ORIENTATION=+